MTITAACAIIVVALGQTAEPKVFTDYVEPGVGYLHAALPVERSLTSAELDRWATILTASDAQSVFIQSLYEQYVAEHNELLDREMPIYLEKAADVYAIHEMHGMTSDVFQSAWKDVSRSAHNLMDRAERIELGFIHSLEPILTREQTILLPVLEGFASRRRCRLASTSNRWIKHEMRDVWDSLPPETVSPDARAAAQQILADYESQLSAMLCRWSSAHFEAARRAQQHFIQSAQGISPAPELDPARAWGRRLMVAQQIRSLQLRAYAQMQDAIGLEADRLRTAWKLHFFPELYPDSAAAHHVLYELAEHEAVPERDRSAIAGLLAWYEPRYDTMCDRLEAFCIEWDDDVESGVSRARRSQGLKEALEPLLEERRELSHEVRQRLENAVSEATLQLYRDANSPHVRETATE